MRRNILRALIPLVLGAASLFAADAEKKVGMTVPTTGKAKMVGEISLKKIPATMCAMVKVSAASCEPEGGYKEGNEGYDQAFEAMMNKGFGSLMGWMQAPNTPMGPAMAIYHQDPTNTPVKDLACTVGFPAAKDAKGNEQVKIEELAACEAAVVQYSGDYKEAGPIWNALTKWVMDNGYEPAGDVTEVYLKSAHDTKNPEEYLTEIRWPVKKKAKE